jgi:Family of unknown function (DUF6499)
MPRADWRLPADYEHLRSLDAPGFAWEFLSRNPEFERDRTRLEQAARESPLSAGELRRFAQRWGVRFRNARLRCWRARRPVDRGYAAEHDPDSSPPG